MKVILSRKGFDSENGAYPSPILPNGQMISLPIPDQNMDDIKYSDVKTGELTCYDLMKLYGSSLIYMGSQVSFNTNFY